MIQIQLQAAGKKFQGQWIFRNLDLQVSGPERIAITGLNGSGKSTLLQVLSGFQSLNEGRITYSEKGALIRPESWYTYLGYAAPYLDLPEEYNMHELISFHAAFKPFQHTLDEKSIIEIMELEGSSRKAIR
ncbi:MAG: ATP-binding cassette domain-containing protein, partial [Bacteroidia bacterium]|nr:ATP-binding cassette domain-containing protein [Bacteroidia bacterium]